MAKKRALKATKERRAGNGRAREASANPTTACDQCDGGCVCGGYSDCERCNGVICEKCHGTGVVGSETDEGGIHFADQFSSPPFRVVVGAEKKEYYVNRDLLSAKSPYFKTMLSFKGAESQNNSVTLEEASDTVEAFRMFVEYIYFDEYEPDVTEEDIKMALLHAKVYVLAERLCMDDLKDLAFKKTLASLSLSEIGKFKAKNQQNEVCPNGHLKAMHAIPLRPSYAAKCSCDFFNRVRFISQDDINQSTAEDIATTVEIVRLVYENTPDQCHPNPEETQQDSGKSATEEPSSQTNSSQETTTKVTSNEPMRLLVSRYCASYLLKLKLDPAFCELVGDYGDFAIDLIKECENGKKIEGTFAKSYKEYACSDPDVSSSQPTFRTAYATPRGGTRDLW